MSNTDEQNYYYGQQSGMPQATDFEWSAVNQGAGVSFGMDANFGQEQYGLIKYSAKLN